MLTRILRQTRAKTHEGRTEGTNGGANEKEMVKFVTFWALKRPLKAKCQRDNGIGLRPQRQCPKAITKQARMTYNRKKKSATSRGSRIGRATTGATKATKTTTTAAQSEEASTNWQNRRQLEASFKINSCAFHTRIVTIAKQLNNSMYEVDFDDTLEKIWILYMK